MGLGVGVSVGSTVGVEEGVAVGETVGVGSGAEMTLHPVKMNKRKVSTKKVRFMRLCINDQDFVRGKVDCIQVE